MFPLAKQLLQPSALEHAGLKPARGVTLQLLKNWPLRGWLFRGATADVDAEVMAAEVYAFAQSLQELDIAHNVHIFGTGSSALVFPRRIANSQGIDASRLQVAGHELLGWWIVSSSSDFENLDAAAVAEHLHAVSLDNVQSRGVFGALMACGWNLQESLQVSWMKPDRQEL